MVKGTIESTIYESKLKTIARHTFREVIKYYDDPEHRAAFERWQRKREAAGLREGTENG